MPREKASTKWTGGGGLTFADKVAAAFLAGLLRRNLILGADAGAITEIHFETRESGNLLDDQRLRRKQPQLTTTGINSKFVSTDIRFAIRRVQLAPPLR